MNTSRRNPTDFPVLDSIARRWSPVGFDAQPVERGTLLRILEAGRWAASTFNEQPWRFVVGPRGEGSTFDRILATLVPANQEWARHAGALVLVCTRLHYTHNEKPNAYAWFDAGQCLAHLFLQTIEEGLHGHAMAGFDRAKARESFGIDAGFEPLCVLAIGRHVHNESLAEATTARDQKPRVRRPLAELISGDQFGQSPAWVDEPGAS